MENRKPLLKVEGLSTGYGRLRVLTDLHLTVCESEIVCVIGPNGAGKSTVLNAIYGFLPPWEGTVTFKSEEMTSLPVTRRVTRGMALVHQGDNIFSNLTIQENLEMGGYLVPDSKERKTRLREAFERFPFLQTKRRHLARSLSGGERQLLAIAMALMTKPDLLLLDEPSMGLSPRMMAQLFSWVKQIHEEGKAILMVEQNAKQALQIAHRGYVLDLGKNRFEGKAQTLLDDPDIKRLYLGGGGMHEDLP